MTTVVCVDRGNRSISICLYCPAGRTARTLPVRRLLGCAATPAALALAPLKAGSPLLTGDPSSNLRLAPICMVFAVVLVVVVEPVAVAPSMGMESPALSSTGWDAPCVFERSMSTCGIGAVPSLPEVAPDSALALVASAGWDSPCAGERSISTRGVAVDLSLPEVVPVSAPTLVASARSRPPPVSSLWSAPPHTPVVAEAPFTVTSMATGTSLASPVGRESPTVGLLCSCAKSVVVALFLPAVVPDSSPALLASACCVPRVPSSLWTPSPLSPVTPPVTRTVLVGSVDL